jgi:hypothetical protein
MNPLAVHEPRQYDGGRFAMAKEPFRYEDLRLWLDSTGDAVASDTSPPPPPSKPTPAEDYADQFGPTLAPSPAAVAHSSHAEKRFRPKARTNALRSWIKRFPVPYTTLEEKKRIAETLDISVAQVTTFCHNYRKRFYKIGDMQMSYRQVV